MKKVIINSLTWFLVQIYVSCAIIFYSKDTLERIAIAGNNHPLLVFGVAKWARVWGLTVLSIGFWFIWFGPWLNLVVLGNSPKTWFGEVTDQYTFVFLGNHVMSLPNYWISGMTTGVFLQFIELYSYNNLEHFRRFIGYGVTYAQGKSSTQNFDKTIA